MSDRPKYLDILYANYREWKLTNFQINVPAEQEVFGREIKRLDLAKNARILEVGFGEGHFLDWARDQGYEVEGAEISSEYVSAASARGHRAFHGTVENLSRNRSGTFDAIVSFDVLEHLSVEEIVEFFNASASILSKDGVILARFPNGGSPFGRFYQHGDATHRTSLTASKVDQLAFLAGFRVTGSFNAARVLSHGRFWGLPARLKRLLAILIEWLVGKLYFGTRQPIDPNLVVHVRRANKSPSLAVNQQESHGVGL